MSPLLVRPWIFSLINQLVLFSSCIWGFSFINSNDVTLTRPRVNSLHRFNGSIQISQRQLWIANPNKFRLQMTTRRDILGECLVFSLLPTETSAPISNYSDSINKNLENIKPYAPLEALLPATRVRILINEAVNLAHQLVRLQAEKGEDNGPRVSILLKLNAIFADSPDNIPFPPDAPSGSESKISSYYSRAYIDELKSLPLTEVPLAILTQLGNYRQYSLLRNRQNKMEKENTFRAAFNFYTRQLRFDAERYLWTASREERKKFIRQFDALPDVSTVITSDLDLRDLIRNQILDAWDEARGEFYFQMTEILHRTPPFSRESIQHGKAWENGDWSELEILLSLSQKFCDQWFDFIPEQDQADALAVVLKEE